MFFKPANILSFLFIVLCIYGGSGFYLEDYCCNDCREVGIDAVLADECHNIHKTECHTECSDIEHEQEDADCRYQCITGKTCCSITTYKVDVYIVDYKPQIHVPISDLPYPLRHLFNKELTASLFRECLNTNFLPVYSLKERQVLYATFLI